MTDLESAVIQAAIRFVLAANAANRRVAANPASANKEGEALDAAYVALAKAVEALP